MAWLSDWEKRIKCVIDQTKIDTANQLNLPVLAYLSISSGITSADITCFFDELDYPSVDDGFTGSNGSAPNSDLWTGVTNCEIQSNKLRFPLSSAYGTCRSVWRLGGDFDIQVDFDLITYPTTDSWAANLLVYFSNGDMFLVRRQYSGGAQQYIAQRKISGSYTTIGSVGTSDTSGKLRIVRSGTNYSLYYYNAGWIQLGSSYSYSTSVECEVKLERNSWGGNPSSSHNFDNFTVNSGAISWLQKTHPNRKKIALTTSDGTTQCYVEIERWDDANEKAWLWVKVPSAAYNSDTDLFLYYDVDHVDNTTYIGDIGSTPAQAVWDSNFVGVWHMGQDPSGGANCIKDSTSNGNDGTPGGSMVSGDLVDGKIGKALDFDLNQYIDCNADSTLKPIEITIEGIWYVNAVVAADTNAYLNRYDGSGDNRSWLLGISHTDGKVLWGVGIDGTSGNMSWMYSQNALTLTANKHIVGVASSADDQRLYIDGTQDGVKGTWASNIYAGTASFYMSCMSDSSNADIDGIQDEVRISNIARSAPWIKATYHSNSDSLMTFGSEETIVAWMFDGKLRIKDTKDDLFDGKLEVAAGIKTSLFDGKLRIKDTGDNLFDGKLRIKDTGDNLFDGKLRVKDTDTGIFDGKLWIALVSRLRLLGGFGEPSKLDVQEPLGVSGVRKILLGLGDALEYLLHIPMAEGNQQLVINRLSDCISAIQLVINELSVGDPASGKLSLFTSLQSDEDVLVLRNELSGIVAGIQNLITALTDNVSSHASLINELALKDDIHSLLTLLGSMPDPAVLYPDCILNVYLDGVPIKPKQITSLSFTMDRGVTFDVLSINSTDMRLYASLQTIVGNKDSVIEVQYQGTSWMFLIEEVSGFELSFSVWGRSIAAAKSDAPFKDSANFVLKEDTVASIVAEDLVPELSVTWNAVDWAILADWSVDGTPVQMLKILADSIGAVVRSYPDGTGFYVDEKYTTRPVNLPYAASEADFDRDVNLISLDASRDLGTGANAVTVHGHSPLSKYSVRLEADSCVEVGSPAVIKVYPALNGLGYSLIASDGAPTYQHSLAEEHTEVVNFVGGKGSVSYPITALTSITWDGAAPAGFEYTAGQDEIVLTDDTPAAVGEVVYSTRYDVWHGAHSEEGQLLVVCYLDESGGIVARVYFDEGDREADDIDKPILTSIVAAVAAGQAFLDDTSYNRLLRSISAPCSDVSDGDVVCVSSDLSGVTGNTIVLRHEVSAQVDGEALKISSNLEVVQFEV